ncbi:MAG: DUF423 domain-containing protein [Bacteroidia bacterium]|nr:DUF423 domain-containing protein [Bacteroidia bacterium]
MNLSRISIAIGAFLGLSGVIAGAMGAHALKEVLEPSQLDSFETAVRFQMYHAMAFLILGLLIHSTTLKGMRTVLFMWGIGTLLFSGSIYLLVLTSLKVGIITPIGGVFLIIGWGVLLLSAFRK